MEEHRFGAGGSRRRPDAGFCECGNEFSENFLAT